MANVLNQIISNKPINKNGLTMQAKPAYTIDTKGKVKPLEDKAKLLPSRVFGSPIDYAKDLKQDILNIGKAAKGKANDHELGRINDLAMKLGSGVLAAYLFVKNPFKLNKAMQIVGAGTFFASMALWPKLFIQAPLKARTGVDIHQKYIDSQGRKKMLHQDPQYDLTDLYSREDLDQMGEKLQVNENLPDRDNFIKQRAKKTAVQGNTLWMLTAGFATPLGSALLSNRLEEPVSIGIEKANAVLSEGVFKSKFLNKLFGNITANKDMRYVAKFCKENSNKQLTNEMIEELSIRLTKGLPKEITTALSNQIKEISKPQYTVETLTSILDKCGVNANTIGNILPAERDRLLKLLSSGKRADLMEIAKYINKNGGTAKELSKNIAELKPLTMTVGQLQSQLTGLGQTLGNVRGKGKIINKFIAERVGDQQNSYIANQWGRATKKFIKSVGLSDKELKAVANGDFTMFEKKLVKLAENPTGFILFRNEFFDIISDYDKKTGESFLEAISKKATSDFAGVSSDLKGKGFDILAEAFAETDSTAGSALHTLVTNARRRADGARFSFYRMFQNVDIRREDVLKKSLVNSGVAEERIKPLVELCKKVAMDACTPDFIEKLKNDGFDKITDSEFKAVVNALFDNANATPNDSVKKYGKDFIEKVVNTDIDILRENANRRCVSGNVIKPNFKDVNDMVGSFRKAFQDKAQEMVNSRKWLKGAGIAFAVLATVTLIATLAIGRKSKIEKQVEESNKVNG